MNPKVTFYLPCVVVPEESWFSSCCPALDVYSQGETPLEAKQNLIEALHGFISTCFEMGTLEQVMKECGFSLAVESMDYDGDMVEVPMNLLTLHGCKNEPHYAH